MMNTEAQPESNPIPPAVQEPTDPTSSEALHGRRYGNERAASLVEYALLLSLIAIVMISAVTTLGGTVNTNFTNANDRIAAAEGD